MSLGRLTLFALASGVAGWAIENAIFPETGGHFSKGFGKLPFLPVYAAGGVAVALAAPSLAKVPVLGRTAIYGAGLSGLELVACRMDRSLAGKPSWSYGHEGGCVDLPHAVAWGLLALGAEATAKHFEVA